jgi:two-component SAPR family response regulator
MCPPKSSEDVIRSKGPTAERSEAVRIWLLGGFQVSVGSRTVDKSAWRLRKAAALIKLLALAPGHRLHREQVMEALWPGSDRKAGSNNLRRTLHAARRALDPVAGSRYLASDGESLVLCQGGPLWVDAEAELVPDALDPNVHERVADAVREAAVGSGVAHLEWVPAGL